MQTVLTERPTVIFDRTNNLIAPSGGSHLLSQIAQAKSGERLVREDLLQQYTPLVLHVVSRVRGRFVQVGRDPEIGVGLLALNSAIDGYRPERGTFVAFATLIIKRRLIDYDRAQTRNVEWTFSDIELDDAEGLSLSQTLSRQAMEHQRLLDESDERREEIRLYELRLQDFGIQFKNLEADSPKREFARRRIIDCTVELVKNPVLCEQLLRTKELPLKELVEILPIARKTVERNRRYIIAVALVLLGGFQFLRKYIMPYLEQSGQSAG